MTQPHRQPERPKPPHDPRQDPFDQDSLSLPQGTFRVHTRGQVAPQRQNCPLTFDPLDQLAQDLHELGLYVRREIFLSGVTWQIAANETIHPYREVRIRLAEHYITWSSEELLKISVRTKELRPDCKAAGERATLFIRGGSGTDHSR